MTQPSDSASSPRRVLVIGAGTSGNAAAILLRRAGIDVDLVEVASDGNAAVGSGITLQGNALRVLRELGVWEQVRREGYAFDEVGITIPDGTVLHVQKDIRTGGDDLPATLGMQRPRLQQILLGAVRASGADLRLGVTAEALVQDPHGVTVDFSDGRTSRYDLVIAADGLNSRTRAAIGIAQKPEPTGMAIWRVAAPRPLQVTRTDLAYGGRCYIAGYCPTSESTLYAYLVEGCHHRTSLDPASYAARMRDLAAGYGGVWPQIAKSITDEAMVNYTWFDRLLVEGSWHRGRVVLVGDAAHACPPTLAQGAAMSLEDALVLAELLTSRETWDGQLLQEYYERRIARVRPVVDASVQLGQWQLDGVRDADVPGLIGRTLSPLKERP
ncbi:FAD-dependent oxidoreductase [Actinocrinis sp.]|uniref:FAD-dependent oxidoreductase n=1 Tax=Actinocrinis sp. TaxID=1920516 RepID=UPI002D71EFAC|nr:FAD-dependent oxidoreductase [Actinocrinis sp.]HZP52099.1 FAD-dependent oxidoreductase [Actinocrinis sp.]